MDQRPAFDVEVHRQLVEQLDWHWRTALRPRLAGLSDAEYHEEPVPGCWGVRPRGTSSAPLALGSGPFTLDEGRPALDPAPVTTIAWRIAHLVGLFAARAAAQFGAPAYDQRTWRHAGGADEGLAQLDTAHGSWSAGVRGLRPAQLSRPSGASEGPWADQPLLGLVLHVNREAIHHGAEMALLRDLHRWRA